MSNSIEEKIAKLEENIKYENAMYETALAYPTETEQFYRALEQTRVRISGLYDELESLKKKQESK